MDTPILQKIAIRLLSQTASSSGCERNWSVFERIHTKRRNRLEHKRLSDLVFVHYNMRLQHRYPTVICIYIYLFVRTLFLNYNVKLYFLLFVMNREYYGRKQTCDPVDCESIDGLDMWMYDTTPDLDIDSLEAAFQEGDDYSSVDFGLGVGGANHENINTIGLP
ncbi:hypothetical protein LINPERHAP1_LOCUS4793 [Linum perenne]